MVLKENGKPNVQGIIISVLLALLALMGGYTYGQSGSAEAQLTAEKNCVKLENLDRNVDQLVTSMNEVIKQNTTLIAELAATRKGGP